MILTYLLLAIKPSNTIELEMDMKLSNFNKPCGNDEIISKFKRSLQAMLSQTGLSGIVSSVGRDHLVVKCNNQRVTLLFSNTQVRVQYTSKNKKFAAALHTHQLRVRNAHQPETLLRNLVGDDTILSMVLHRISEAYRKLGGISSVEECVCPYTIMKANTFATSVMATNMALHKLYF